ncbi:MAG: RtcB family protein [Aeromonas popoffii]|uniref:RtcB family protein n=1 Tax=Aeromonas popoffii TaxID=70856 RepID=UPI003F305ED3
MKFKIFGDIVCGKTLSQMHESMANDFVVKGALMPDAHAGYSLPIGGVVMTEGCIVPAWVGYDIGCGMRGVRTNIIREDMTTERLEKVKGLVLKSVPMGQNKHPRAKANEHKFEKMLTLFTPLGQEIANTRGMGQLGTLGGGNHFVEIGYDEENWVWVCVHSGSRGVGHAIATYYMKKAAEEAGVMKGNVEGGFPLQVGTDLFNDYKKDMDAALIWSQYNRMLMTDAVMKALDEVFGDRVKSKACIDNIHNTAVQAQDQFLHRKGATSAGTGELGIIPGNMRDGFFVVRGLGNAESMCSASHGAGRVMSRGEAKAKIDFDEFQKQMEHVVTNVSIHTVDEAPDAYKDIFDVMDSQKDCVEILHHVKPLLNLKG